jgi:autotransporter-associated beta strand protein
MALSDLTRWLPRLGRRRPKASRRAARPTTLRLEGLETREVPATHTWTDLGGTNNWSDAGNWGGGVPTTGEAGGTIVVLPLNDASMFQDIPNLTVDQLNFTNTTSALLSLTQPLTVSGTSLLDNVINTSGTNTVLGSGTNELRLAGSLNPFFKMTAGTLTVDAVVSGPHDLVVHAGGGVLELAKDNTYTGDTHVNQGILRLNGPAGGAATIPAGKALVVGDGSTNVAEAFVQLGAAAQLDPTTPVTVDSDGVLSLVNGSANTIGDVTLAGGQLAANTGNLGLAGKVHATADSGITTGVGGHVSLTAGQHAVTVDAGKTLTVSAGLQDAAGAVGGVTLDGGGTLVYQTDPNAPANTYTGPTVVNNGTLLLNKNGVAGGFAGPLSVGDGSGVPGSAVVRLSQILELPTNAQVTMKNDGLLDLNGKNDTVGDLTALGGAAVTTGGATLTLNGDITVTGPALLPVTITGNVALAGSFHNFTAADNLAASDLVINGVISGASDLYLNGPGTFEFEGTAANTFTGQTVVDGATLLLNQTGITNGAVSKDLLIANTSAGPGVVRLLQDGQIPNDGQVSFIAGTLDLNGHLESVGKLVLDNGTHVTTGAAGKLTLNDDVSMFGTGSTLAAIDGNLDLGGVERTFTVSDSPAATDLVINAAMTNGSLKKLGNGSLILQGVSPAVNVTVLDGLVGGTGVVGNLTAGPGTLNPGVLGAGTLTAKNLTVSGIYAVDLNGPAAGQSDQVKALGAVDLTGATLTVSLGFTPSFGQTFTVVDNEGSDPVTGAFNGLAEGKIFAAKGRMFQINYTGGDGNDVVLTDVTAPGGGGGGKPSPQPFAVGPDAGGGPIVRVFTPDGKPTIDLPVFEPDFGGGVRTAVADVTGDGTPDVIVGTGVGREAEVRVYDGVTNSLARTFTPFGTFEGGVFVATADFNGDGFADVVVTPDEGGGPRVVIFSGKDGAVLANFYGIDDPNFRGGARAAAGDVNGDGTPDLVVAAGFGGGPRVSVYDGTTLGGTPTTLVHDFFVFEQSLRNGVYVTAGDLDGDGKADLIFGGGPGGGPRVFTLSGAEMLKGNDGPTAVLADFFAGNPDNRGGVRVAAKDLDGDTKADLVVGDGAGAGSHVTVYHGADFTGGTAPAAFEFDAYPGFNGGVFVG